MAEGTCSIAGCEKPNHCKSYCENHYRKFRKYGDPLAGKSHVRLTGTPEERFWPRVDKNGPIPEHRPDLGPCWLWTTTASTKNGYPQFRCGDRMVLTHRFSYESKVGPIPAGLEIDHLCRTKKCVNPAHLQPVTQPVNAFRTRGHRNTKSHCVNGHEFTEENTMWGGRTGNHRTCRTCSREKVRQWQQKNRSGRASHNED